MADPYQYITTSGVILPDTSDILAGVELEWQTKFGVDLATDPETPQGVLINAEALTRAEVVRNNAALANQINPNISGGVFLDALCALTGLDVPPATVSVVPSVALAGVAGSLIPIGVQAKTPTGDIFQSVSAVTLDGSGNATVNFQSLATGPIPCGIGDLTSIVTPVIGWETVSSPTAAVLGVDELSDSALRALRAATLALQGSSLAAAITAAVAVVPGVKSQQFRENVTDSTATIDGISLVAHSVWSCVAGGTDLDVATALLTAKSGGANWNGATTVNVTDPASGQVYPVSFDRPTAVPMAVRATIRPPSSALSPVTATQQAILDYANGVIPDQPGFVTGGSVSPFEIAGAVMSEIPGVYVKEIEVGTVASGPTYQTTEVALALNQVATLAVGNITVVVLS